MSISVRRGRARTLVGLSGYVCAVASPRNFLRRAAIRRATQALTGTLLIALRGVLGGSAGAMTVRAVAAPVNVDTSLRHRRARKRIRQPPRVSARLYREPRRRLGHPTALPVRLDTPGAAARSVF